jgi:hypothetical protein
MAYQSRVALPLEYKGIKIANGYFIDLLIQDSRLSAGLLINFNVPILPRGIRRILR